MISITDHEIVLFIDGLDQLSDRDRARRDISFLKGVKPHPNTVIIVSCLPDEKDSSMSLQFHMLRNIHE